MDGMIFTAFVDKGHIDLDARISAPVPKDLSIHGC